MKSGASEVGLGEQVLSPTLRKDSYSLLLHEMLSVSQPDWKDNETCHLEPEQETVEGG